MQQKGKPMRISIDPTAVLGWLNGSTECLTEVVQLLHHHGVPVFEFYPSPCNELRAQAFSACLACCHNKFPLLTAALGAAFFASVGSTGGAVVGGFFGGLIGGALGKKFGQDQADRYCAPLCDQLTDWDCNPCKTTPEWDPLKEIKKAWPKSPDDWVMLK
jgi:hypothetical protein